MASAKAALAETEAQLKDADQEFQRTTELAKQHIASQSDLDLAESNAKALQAHLAQQKLDVVVAERQVAMWQQQMDDMIIRAPFDGVITTKDAQPGEMISPVSAGGGFTRTGIGTIVDMSSLEIEIDVNESYINRVEPGQPVEATLDAYPDWKIPCKVIAIIPTADRDKSTVKVRVGFDQLDPRILPDMSVKVAFRDNGGTAAGHAVIVPKNAVLNRDGRDVVFVVQDGHAERRAVTVSDTQGDDSVLSAGVAAGEKVIVDAPADLQDGMAVKEKKSMSENKSNNGALVQVEGVEKVFHRGSEDIHVLADLNLQVPAGEFLALMGPSGSGKTTLLNLIGGLDRPTNGTVTVAGERIDQLSDRALAAWRARHIGFVFQLYNLMPVLTAERNVELPLLLTHLSKAERQKHVETALAVVGLSHRAKHYPRTLSGGEQQRVGIARGIVTDPTLLLCDEPTGDLDRKAGDEILDLLQALNREHGKTIIMVTHDPHASARAARTLHLDKGQLSNGEVK